jgi:NAD(P)H-binding
MFGRVCGWTGAHYRELHHRRLCTRAATTLWGGVVVVFVIGATGKVGRHVVFGLLERDVGVRALVRDPDIADLPKGVDLVRGDLSDPRELNVHLDGIEAVFLVWPFYGADGAAEVVDIVARRAPCVVYLSAEAGESGRTPSGRWLSIESRAPWTRGRSCAQPDLRQTP